jgi:threonine dehydrogenase-like Zn-dependent dehydrogenase
MTGGYGADMQIEAAGAASATIAEIEKSFAPNGKMIYLGRQDNCVHMQFDTLVSQANQIMGARGHSGHGIYPNVIRLLATGRVPAHKMITSRFPFDRVIDAIKQSTSRMDGKIIVHFP